MSFKWQAGLVAGALNLALAVQTVCAAPPAADTVRQLAPTGRLRAAINFGNPVLAQEDPKGGEPRGISVELARDLGHQFGVPVEFVPFHEAGQVTDSVGEGRWDVCFLAIDPVRGKQLDYTSPYVVIEGTYLAPKDSAFSDNPAVDRAGVRIGVAKGSAYDLFLTRELKAATLVRAANGAAAYTDLAEGRADVVAGVRQPLDTYAASHPGVQVMPGHFMAIKQAMCLPKGRADALSYLTRFVEDRKTSDFVRDALLRTGQSPGLAAPAGSRR